MKLGFQLEDSWCVGIVLYKSSLLFYVLNIVDDSGSYYHVQVTNIKLVKLASG